MKLQTHQLQARHHVFLGTASSTNPRFPSASEDTRPSVVNSCLFASSAPSRLCVEICARPQAQVSPSPGKSHLTNIKGGVLLTLHQSTPDHPSPQTCGPPLRAITEMDVLKKS